VLQGAAVDLTQWLGADGITAENDDVELLLAEAATDTTANSTAAVAAAAAAVDITAALQDMRIEAQLIEVKSTWCFTQVVTCTHYAKTSHNTHHHQRAAALHHR
jgi:hypothetical protein